MTKTTNRKRTTISTIFMSAILIGVVFTFNTPLNEAQAVHPDKNNNPITICQATNPHLNMMPQTDMQPDPLFTAITNPPDFMVTWTFNKPIADSLAAHGLGFLTLTGPGLSIQPTSFGPVTNGDLTVKINFDGATVAAALEQHLINLNLNEADVSLGLFANYGIQPHLFDDTNNQSAPGIICATSADGRDTIKVIRNQAPDCTNAEPSETLLWPPNHKFVDISISGVTDPDGDSVTITIDGITQDEATNGLGDGDKSPDGDGVGTDTAQVRAERSGLGDGRVYEISFTADDGNGGTCTGSVQVGVPHDQKKPVTAVDSGQSFDSTLP